MKLIPPSGRIKPLGSDKDATAPTRPRYDPCDPPSSVSTEKM
jgi:hypothetical protein